MSTLMTPNDYVAVPTAVPQHRFHYGDGAEQFGEMFLPETPIDGPRPVVLLLHGGCWRHAFGLAPLGQMAAALTTLGFAVCNLEYRRLDGGGGWPHTFTDVAAGADHLAQIATEYRLDVDRLIVAGHSAGGHLALWLAGRPRLPAGAEIGGAGTVHPGAIVSLAGIGDLALAEAEGVCRGAPGELVGGSIGDFPERYAAASPAALLPLGVPQWHVAGHDDVLVPADFVRRFAARAELAGDTALLVTVADAGHFEIVTAGSSAWPRVEAVFLEALQAVS